MLTSEAHQRGEGGGLNGTQKLNAFIMSILEKNVGEIQPPPFTVPTPSCIDNMYVLVNTKS